MWTARSGQGEGELFRSFKYFASEFGALSLPLGLYHFWESVYNNVQKTPHYKPEDSEGDAQARLGSDKFFERVHHMILHHRTALVFEYCLYDLLCNRAS